MTCLAFMLAHVTGIMMVFGGDDSDFLAMDVNKFDNSVNIDGDQKTIHQITPTLQEAIRFCSRSVFDDSALQTCCT